MSSSLDDRPAFDALLELLPPHRREEPAGAWDIGEQEGAMAELVEALADTRTAISDLTRARIAVLAEAWGCWGALCGPLAACQRTEHEAGAGAGAGASVGAVTIIEHSDEGRDLTTAITRGLTGEDPWPGHTTIAWITCRHCHDVLVRVHETMPWGPSLVTHTYAIVQPGWPHTQVHAMFDNGTAALTALVETHHSAI